MRISDWSSDVCSSDLIEPHVVAVAREETVRLHLDRHDRVAVAAGAGLALAPEPHLRARFDAGGQFEVDRRSVAQRDPLRFQRGGIGEGHLQQIGDVGALGLGRSEEHTSELQSLMRLSYAVLCMKKKIQKI